MIFPPKTFSSILSIFCLVFMGCIFACNDIPVDSCDVNSAISQVSGLEMTVIDTELPEGWACPSYECSLSSDSESTPKVTFCQPEESEPELPDWPLEGISKADTASTIFAKDPLFSFDLTLFDNQGTQAEARRSQPGIGQNPLSSLWFQRAATKAALVSNFRCLDDSLLPDSTFYSKRASEDYLSAFLEGLLTDQFQTSTCSRWQCPPNPMPDPPFAGTVDSLLSEQSGLFACSDSDAPFECSGTTCTTGSDSLLSFPPSSLAH